MTSKTIGRIAGALFIVTIGAIGSPLQAASSFPAAVEQILMSQTDGRVSKLDTTRKRALVVCVNEVLTDMPNGMKRYVLAANSFDDMESRFGKVVMENRAEWKQKIARGCAHIVV